MAITEYSECAVTVRGTFFPPGTFKHQAFVVVVLVVDGRLVNSITIYHNCVL